MSSSRPSEGDAHTHLPLSARPAAAHASAERSSRAVGPSSATDDLTCLHETFNFAPIIWGTRAVRIQLIDQIDERSLYDNDSGPRSYSWPDSA